MTKFAVALAILALDFYIYKYFATEEFVPPRTSLEEFPREIAEWKCDQTEEMTPDVLVNLGVTDYFLCNLTRADMPFGVSMYVGYHASQVRKEGGGSNETMIHPPAHCLPGSGWDIIASSAVPLDVEGLPGRPALVNRLIVAKGESRQLVYYWYQERGRVIHADWRKILDLFWDRATRRRTDGALVRFTVPVLRNDEARSEEALLTVTREVVKRLPAFVPN